jgi:peptide/nickel transport system ATP-binding protein
MSDAPLLHVQGLVRHFSAGSWLARRPSVKAVDGVTFAVARGEIMGLAGESGSGKSTIARMVVGLDRPSGGRILFDGRDLASGFPDRAFRRRIQIVSQNPGSSFNPRRTIGASVALPLQVHGLGGPDRRRRVGELLERVELPAAFATRYPHQLSGGQRQRAAVARALAAEPELLVLDEPTSALDVSVQAKIVELLLRLVRELGLTYLFISHDLALMRQFASRVGVLHLGRLVEIDTVHRIFADPRHPYTRRLLAAIPVVSEAEERLKPSRDPMQETADG